MHHKSKNSHHSSTAVVELNATLLKLRLLIEGIPAKVKGAITEVTGELGGSGNILHDGKLENSNESNELKKTSLGDGVGAVDSGKSVRVGVEGVTRVVDVSGKVDTSTGDDVAKEGLFRIMMKNSNERLQACISEKVATSNDFCLFRTVMKTQVAKLSKSQ